MIKDGMSYDLIQIQIFILDSKQSYPKRTQFHNKFNLIIDWFVYSLMTQFFIIPWYCDDAAT